MIIIFDFMIIMLDMGLFSNYYAWENQNNSKRTKHDQLQVQIYEASLVHWVQSWLQSKHQCYACVHLYIKFVGSLMIYNHLL